MKRTLNVVIADDHPIYVEGLRSVLNSEVGEFSINIIGIARTGTEVMKVVRATPPELLLLDLNLPEADGLKILPMARKDFPEMRILVLTVYEDPKLVKAAFKGGTDGYILKTSGRDEIFKGIGEVMIGNTFMGRGVEVTDPTMRSAGVGKNVYEDKFAKKNNLTRREMEVLRHIGQALNNKDISERLFISDQTVSVHRKNIMRKLGVNSTASLIKIAYDNNLV